MEQLRRNRSCSIMPRVCVDKQDRNYRCAKKQVDNECMTWYTQEPAAFSRILLKYVASPEGRYSPMNAAAQSLLHAARYLRKCVGRNRLVENREEMHETRFNPDGTGRELYGQVGRRRKRNGAEDRTRTDDLLITNQLLYQLSYFGLALIRLYRCGS